MLGAMTSQDRWKMTADDTKMTNIDVTTPVSVSLLIHPHWPSLQLDPVLVEKLSFRETIFFISALSNDRRSL